MTITKKNILESLKVPCMGTGALLHRFEKYSEPRHIQRMDKLVLDLKKKGQIVDYDFVTTEIVDGQVKETVVKGIVTKFP